MKQSESGGRSARAEHASSAQTGHEAEGIWAAEATQGEAAKTEENWSRGRCNAGLVFPGRESLLTSMCARSVAAVRGSGRG
eukprot:6096667-Pyramimonas_sp.AAC.1